MPRRVNLLSRGTVQVGAILIGTTDPALVIRGSGAPTDGTSGTGAGEANKASKVPRHHQRRRVHQHRHEGVSDLAARRRACCDPFVAIALTNAEILALRATPKTLLAAPGAGFRWQFLDGTINLNLTAAYTESADNFAVKYVNGSGVAVSETVETTGVVDQTGKIHTNIFGKKDVIATEAQATNQALVLHNTGDGELGGGNAANTWPRDDRRATGGCALTVKPPTFQIALRGFDAELRWRGSSVIALEADGALPDWIQICTIGSFQKGDRKFSITPAMLAEMVENFSSGKHPVPPTELLRRLRAPLGRRHRQPGRGQGRRLDQRTRTARRRRDAVRARRVDRARVGQTQGEGIQVHLAGVRIQLHDADQRHHRLHAAGHRDHQSPVPAGDATDHAEGDDGRRRRARGRLSCTNSGGCSSSGRCASARRAPAATATSSRRRTTWSSTKPAGRTATASTRRPTASRRAARSRSAAMPKRSS